MGSQPLRLQIRLRRGRDGPDTLHLTREDATSTWQHLPQGQARHDLAHFAVETHLGFTNAFYGLVARGKDIVDFERRETRGPTPDEALVTEFLVNQIMLEMAEGEQRNVDQFNALMDRTLEYHQEGKLRSAFQPLTAGELDAIRKDVRQLWTAWSHTPPGEAMVLRFEAKTG